MPNPYWAVIVRIDESRLQGPRTAGAIGPIRKRICADMGGLGLCRSLALQGALWIGSRVYVW